MNIYIGVDGGCTKTSLVAVGPDGEVLGGITGEGINFNSIGMQRARDNLSAPVKALIRQVGADGYETIFIGMSALYNNPDKKLLDEFCSDAFPVERVVMCSDIVAALYGLTLGAPGVMTVSGTGMMGAAIDSGGKLVYSGGWGYLLNDEGSCYSIGLKGIMAALRDIEGIGAPTILTGRLLEFYKVSDSREFLEYLYSSEVPARVIAYFATEVLSAYKKKDTSARAIIGETVKILVTHTVKLINSVNTNAGSLRVGVYGDLFEKNEDILNLFKKKLYRTHPEIKIEIPSVPPEAGAVIYGLMRQRPGGYKDIINKLASYYIV